MKERKKVGCGWRMSTAGALSAALLMVTPDDGWRHLTLSELLPCHTPSAKLVMLLENECTDRKLLPLSEVTSK